MYLKHRGSKWWALHDIPADCQVALGRRRFAKSLDAEDRATAKILGASLETEWRTMIALAKGDGSLDERANELHLASKRASGDPEHARIYNKLLTAHYDKLGLFQAAPPEGSPTTAEEAGKAAALNRFTKIVTGSLVKLDAHLDEYLKTRKGEEKSLAMKESTIRKFCESFRYVADVRRKGVQEWVNAQAQKGKSKRKGEEGAAPATIRRMLSEIRGYWDYLVSIEEAPEAVRPFEKLSISGRKNGKRQAFTAEDVARLLAAALKRADNQLADLIYLLAYTGCRLEEACIIKAKHINLAEGYVDIHGTKTEAAERPVPLHKKLVPVVKRLMDESKDGFLLSGLSANKHGDRSGAIGKRGNRLIRSLDFDQRYVVHCIRKTVATLLEQAGVPNNVIKDIQGWDRKGDMVGLYSGGTSLEQRKAAIKRIAYPGL